MSGDRRTVREWVAEGLRSESSGTLRWAVAFLIKLVVEASVGVPLGLLVIFLLSQVTTITELGATFGVPQSTLIVYIVGGSMGYARFACNYPGGSGS